MTYDIRLDNRTTAGDRLQTVYLRHQIVDADKIIRIREHMMTHGWQGRPVILAAAGDHHIALTGTHRLAAVAGLDVDVDAVMLPDDLTPEQWDTISDGFDDYDLLAGLRAVAAERGDMDDAVAAMEAEVSSNLAS